MTLCSDIYGVYGDTNIGSASAPVFFIVYAHVAGSVTLDPLDEVLKSFFHVFVHIIWTPRLNLLERKKQRSKLSAYIPDQNQPHMSKTKQNKI